MFLKRKIRAGKVYSHRMLWSLKMSVTMSFFLILTSRRTTVSVVKQPLSDITRFFAGHCPVSGATIQARKRTSPQEKKKSLTMFAVSSAL